MKEQSTSKGFAILSLAGILAKLCSVLYIPLLRYAIGLEGLGIYNQIYEVFTFVYALTSMGLQVAIAKVVSELSACGDEKGAYKSFLLAKRVMFIIGAIATVIMIVFAGKIAEISSEPKIRYGIIMLAPAIMFTTVLMCYRGYFQGKNMMTGLAVSQVLEQIVNVIVSLGFAYMLVKSSVELGAAGGTIGTAVGALIACWYLMIMFKCHKIKKNVLKSKSEVDEISTKEAGRRLLNYGVPITLNSGLQYLGSLIDMINVKGRLLVAGLESKAATRMYGIFGEYKTLINVPLTLSTALCTAVFPAITRAIAVRDRKKANEKINYALKMAVLVALPCAVGLSVLSKEMYIAIYGEEIGYELMLFGSVLVIMTCVVQIQGIILQSLNKFYFSIITMTIGVLAKIGINYTLVAIPSINIMGAVIGGLVYYFIPLVLNHNKLKKILKMKLSLRKIGLKPLIASLIMAVLIYIVKIPLLGLIGIIGEGRISYIIVVLIACVVGVLAYGISIILIGGVTKEELDDISPRVYNILPGAMKRRVRSVIPKEIVM